MGQARLQRHQPNLLEDEVGEGRVLERYCQLGVNRSEWMITSRHGVED